jgi:catechol 2,3-dioxygenase-like lactoylglutathione lyase family enzyme
MLNTCSVIGFIPTKDIARARAFYVDQLNFEAVSEDSFALFISANGTPVRIFNAGEFTPASYTVLGWHVPDIAKTIEELNAHGIGVERYVYLEQNASGIWTAPNGAHVAWFKDPDGNTLSITQV